MEDRFDQLETKMDSLIATVDQKFAGVDKRFDSVDQKFAGVDKRFDSVDLKFAGVSERFDDLSQRVGVLHEDVKRDFRFSLEAQQGLKEQMEAGFAAQAEALKEALAPIKAAVRSAHQEPARIAEV